MRVAVTGAHDWTTDRLPQIVHALRRLDPRVDYVLTGDATGVDSLTRIAIRSYDLPHTIHGNKMAMIKDKPDELWIFGTDDEVQECIRMAGVMRIKVRDGLNLDHELPVRKERRP